MKVPAEFRVGSATHTGLVRSGNEDDYLVVAPPSRQPFALVAAIADGMGGVAGGAEASRTGLRGFAAGLFRDGEPAVGVDGAAPLAAADADADGAAEADTVGAPGSAVRTRATARVAAAFAAAWARIQEEARLVPTLREMGTTMTVLAFGDGRVVVGHIGDTRAYRLRAGVLDQLTTDHSAKGSASRLLRCIGGGLAEGPPDLDEFDCAAGDRFLLCSDGVWGTVEPQRLHEALAQRSASGAADRLVAAALAAGGPDNCTALVVHCLAVAPDLPAVEVALPLEEASRFQAVGRGGRRLGPARWPWLLMALSVLLGAAVALHWAFGFDALHWLLSLV